MSSSKLLVISLATVALVAHAAKTCDVLHYGGVADNATDIALAITKAYTNCVKGSTTTNPADTVLLVPPGTYALKTSVSFQHTDYFTTQIDGDLNLVFNPTLRGTMFTFYRCNYVLWRGNGTIHGHGDLWRPNGDLDAHPRRPRLVRFEDCNNIDMSGVTLLNSPSFHVVIMGNNNVAHDMKIIADHIGATDGFDISGNNNYVHDVSVENGDECVTVKSPTNGFVAENVQCFHSGGCNIGSFGPHGTGVSVQNVYYKNVTQHNGAGGIGLKSYPSALGVVKNATYVDFTFVSLAHPIQVNDFWCGHRKCPSATGNLTWKDITFIRITGTGDHSDRPVIRVECLPGHECTNMTFQDVNLTKEGDVKPKILLSNVCGTGLPNLPAC